MFQLLKDPKIDFMARRQIWLTVSAVLVAASIGLILVRGLNLGVEFTGGTEVGLKFQEAANVEAIRGQLATENIDAQVTTIGDAGDEVLIRVATQEGDTVLDEEMTRRIVAVLRPDSGSGKPDLNVIDRTTIESVLAAAPGLDAAAREAAADAIVSERNDKAIFGSHDDLANLAGLDAGALDHLRGATEVGPLALRQQNYIGPSIGEELKRNSLFAIFGALLGMLAYIWIRFQLGWGLAAVLTLAHDTLVTIGLFIIAGMEMGQPTVAAFLTLVGYSVNDTVVVFDRVRDNMRRKPNMKMLDVINLSINQTLSRTVITSGLTFIAVLAIFLFGGPALRSFSFVLVVGVIVGTYSSIYVASPILLLSQRYIKPKAEPAPAQAKSPA